MLSGPEAFTTVSEELLTATLARLQAVGLEVPARAAVVPAPIVWDHCECGLLAVATGRIYGSDAFPVDRAAAGAGAGVPLPTTALPLPAFLVAELQVAVVRCATTSPQPEAAVLTAEARQGQRDAYEVLVAVACKLQQMHEAGEILDYAMQDQPFLPAQGGCQGGQLNVLVSVPFTCPC